MRLLIAFLTTLAFLAATPTLADERVMFFAGVGCRTPVDVQAFYAEWNKLPPTTPWREIMPFIERMKTEYKLDCDFRQAIISINEANMISSFNRASDGREVKIYPTLVGNETVYVWAVEDHSTWANTPI